MFQHNLGTRFGSIALSACALAGAFVVSTPTALAAQENAAVRYARAADAGAKIYNLADKAGVMIGAVPAKSLLEVYGERAGYLSVVTPSGLDVWVYGQYLRTTETPGIVEVTGDNVFMRPLPSSDPSSYPLQQQLDKGVRLRVVGRKDPAKKISEDWIRVVTPPGARGWVLATETVAVDAKENVREEWLNAVKAGMTARPVYDLKSGDKPAEGAAGAAPAGRSAAERMEATKAAAPAASGAQAASGAAKGGDTYDAATALYEAARSNPNADWNAVRGAYQRYLEKNSNGTQAEAARVQLQRIDLHEEIARLRNDQTMREEKRKELLANAQQRLEEANASKDPLGGRFQARGWVVKEQLVASEPAHYFVYWAGQPQAEIVCSNGRYDLSNFADFDVGVVGAVLRPATAATASSSARPARIDASRLEVLGSRRKTVN